MVHEAVDRRYFQIHITPWRAAVCSCAKADVVGLPTLSLENIVISHYPVLECLVAFAIVFLIGFLSAKSNGSNTASTQQGAVRI